MLKVTLNLILDSCLSNCVTLLLYCLSFTVIYYLMHTSHTYFACIANVRLYCEIQVICAYTFVAKSVYDECSTSILCHLVVSLSVSCSQVVIAFMLKDSIMLVYSFCVETTV